MHIREDQDPTVVASTETADNAGAREMLSAMTEGPVVTIELTPEQQAYLAQQTNGRIDATSLKLRPNLDLKRFLSEVTDIDMSDLSTGIAPPPKDTYWVVTGTPVRSRSGARARTRSPLNGGLVSRLSFRRMPAHRHRRSPDHARRHQAHPRPSIPKARRARCSASGSKARSSESS